MYFQGDRGLNQHLIRSKCQSVMLKQDQNAVFPDHCLRNIASYPVMQTGPDNHHNTLSQNGKEEERVNLGKSNKKDPIRWPRMSYEIKWNFQENSVFLQRPTHGLITKKLGLLEIIPHEEAFICLVY